MSEFDPEMNNGNIPEPDMESVANKVNRENEVSKQNISSLLSSPSTRPKVILVSVVLISCAALAFIGFKSGRGGSDSKSEVSVYSPSQASVNQEYKLNDSVSPELAALEHKSNQAKADEAERNGGSHLEVPMGQVMVPPADPPSLAMPIKEQAQADTQSQQNIEAQERLDRQQYTNSAEVNPYSQAMRDQINAILNEKGGADMLVVKNVRPTNTTNSTNTALSAPASSQKLASIADGVEVSQSTSAESEAGYEKLKAGTVIYATTDYESNSDDTPEIMATLHTGPLKGAKVIGAFTKGRNILNLRFNMLSSDKIDDSISISAIAVDPETGRKGMATSVDNHYFERYALLIGSSFVQGLGEAAMRSNTTISTSGLGSVATQGALDPSKQILVAAGRAGSAVSSELQKNAAIPQTVILKSGQPIGIMLMSDVKYKLIKPKN